MPHDHSQLYLPHIPLGGQPLTADEVSEARAVKVAYYLAVVALRNEIFASEGQAIPVDLFDSAGDWLCQQVRPLAKQSHTIADTLVYLDPLSQSSWDSVPRMRKVIQHLRFQTRRLIPPGGRRG